MAYKTAQEFKYLDTDWWEWSVWIQASDDEMANIDYVEYTLHPTFPNPVRKVTKRATKFRLNSAGWGVFTIYCKLVFLDGTVKNLRHELKLCYPDGTPTHA